MASSDTDDQPKNRETENDNLRPASPPRPATEPDGAEGSTQNNKTLTDPATGEPQDDVSDDPQVPR